MHVGGTDGDASASGEPADGCPSILPCDAAHAGAATAGEVAVRRRLPLPPLPGPRPLRTPGACRCARSGSPRRRSCSARRSLAGVVLRLEHRDARVRPAVQPVPARPRSSSSTWSPSCYRLVAIVDAYRVAGSSTPMPRAAADGSGGPAAVFNPLSVAGLLAVVLVMSGSHVVVARYDLLALDALTTRASSSPIRTATRRLRRDAVGLAGRRPRVRPTSRSTRPTPPTAEPPIQGSALPNVSIPPWDGKERLNILLIGSDEQPGEATYNTDTLIVVSIDPVDQAGRDVQPAARLRRTCRCRPGRCRNAFGGRPTRPRSTRSSPQIRRRPDLVAGHQPDARLQRAQGRPRRALRPRHQVLRRGQLRGLQAGRRRGRRGDDQRPGPGRRRLLPGDPGRRHGSTSRPASST